MDVYYSDIFKVPLPEGHRFPMQKYALLRQKIEQSEIHKFVNLRVPDPASDNDIQLVHNRDYFLAVTNGKLSAKEMRRIGFPWSPELVKRSRHSLGGTIAACRSALRHGVSVNLAGGTHHAFPDHGEGYCVFNDVAVAARTIQHREQAQRILVLDCDVHQGNGTAVVFAGDMDVFTFSIHGEKNYPFRKRPGDLDIALPDQADDKIYLAALSDSLDTIARIFQTELVVYNAGADPYQGDRLGRLSLTKSGLRERDEYVLDWCAGFNLPVAIVLGGGYARDVQDTVEIHNQTVFAALEHFLEQSYTSLKESGY